VRQDEPSRERRWYQDDFFDLFVWTDAAGSISAFQLCYDRSHLERVLVWDATSGFSHRRVDDGESTPIKNMSPIMVSDGRFSATPIAAAFQQRKGELDARMHDFIYRKIIEADALQDNFRSG
jgi:hypothetical protein